MSTLTQHFIAKAAHLYYEQGLSQAQIAVQLNTSRATIGRALQNALQQGYVRIVFDFPNEEYLRWESELESRYGLEEVIITDENVPKEAALYLARSIKSHMSVGITWGRTIKAIVNSFAENEYQRDMKFSDVNIIPLIGTDTPTAANLGDLHLCYSSLLANSFAQLLKGSSFPFPAPMYVHSEKVRDILLNEPAIQEIMEKGRHCDVAVFGIGTIDEHSSMSAVDPDKKNLIRELKEKGAIGEIMGHPFDMAGTFIPNEITNRILGISMEDLKQIRHRVAVVTGEEKASAIRAVCRTHLANVLITDAATAKTLIIEED
ncbi:MAG: sugar-binding transcriptional regulator [Eubacteriales bacterium]|nr:sugar-binding transcriptional regulator [Eubacteriales bacterium]